MISSHKLADNNQPEIAAKKICITQLSLYNFRNYAHAALEVGESAVVLTGRNGAGKTNILEAVSMLVPGRGLRKAKIAQMDNAQAQQPWVISAQINGLQGECQIGCGRDVSSTSDKRLIKIDETPASSQAELGQHLSMLWLTPQMEQLFNQGTSEGRRFLDRLVYSFDAHHATRINKYEFAMRERNRLLSQPSADSHWLDTLEKTMAEMAVSIAQTRLDTLQSLNHAIQLSDRPFPKAYIKALGIVEDQLAQEKSALEVEKKIAEQLQAARRKDAAAGRTLEGTHRSVLDVTHTEKNLPAADCSTGEQKALLLSIILAQAKASALRRQTVPLILLDDVAAHLDAQRRLELFDEIQAIGAQVWMTGTDPDFFSQMGGKVLFFHVDNGKILSNNF